MNLITGQFYWVRGAGICRYSHTLGASAVVQGYDHTTDTFWGNGYVSPSELLRSASDEEVALYKAAVHETFKPRTPSEHTCARCGVTETTSKCHCTRCGYGHELAWPPPGYEAVPADTLRRMRQHT